MKRIRILVLILCACFVSVAWGQQPTCPAYTPWAQFHRANMQRCNPCEKVLNVKNVGNLRLEVELRHWRSLWSPRPPWRMGWFMSARQTATCTR